MPGVLTAPASSIVADITAPISNSQVVVGNGNTQISTDGGDCVIHQAAPRPRRGGGRRSACDRGGGRRSSVVTSRSAPRCMRCTICSRCRSTAPRAAAGRRSYRRSRTRPSTAAPTASSSRASHIARATTCCSCSSTCSTSTSLRSSARPDSSRPTSPVARSRPCSTMSAATPPSSKRWRQPPYAEFVISMSERTLRARANDRLEGPAEDDALQLAEARLRRPSTATERSRPRASRVYRWPSARARPARRAAARVAPPSPPTRRAAAPTGARRCPLHVHRVAQITGRSDAATLLAGSRTAADAVVQPQVQRDDGGARRRRVRALAAATARVLHRTRRAPSQRARPPA